jgi:hypothetical protein
MTSSQGFAGKFHTHITLADKSDLAYARKVIHGKTIEVALEDRQVDPILTHHYVTGYRGVSSHFDIKLQLFEQLNVLTMVRIKVARAKLEAEFDDPRSPPEQRDAIVDAALYVEAHLKTTEAVQLQGWSLSQDHPTGTKTYYTRRWRKTPLTQIRLDVQTAIDQFKTPVSSKIEAVLYDTNPEHDSWWA